MNGPTGPSVIALQEYWRLQRPKRDAVIEAAKDIVALWKSPKIAALLRADRNAAIEDTRKRLIDAVDALD